MFTDQGQGLRRGSGAKAGQRIRAKTKTKANAGVSPLRSAVRLRCFGRDYGLGVVKCSLGVVKCSFFVEMTV